MTIQTTLLRNPDDWKKAWEIIRVVKPKITRQIKKYCHGPATAQAGNGIWEGDNLSAMVSLMHRLGGKVDLIVTDPPYNTGKEFRYNDKWDDQPDDPGLGDVVDKEDPEKHSKWEKFMIPRLRLMRKLLKPMGVLAVCIDHRELFRLGILLNEVFGEVNQVGIINWQKSYAPRNDNRHISTATEYVLVYAKDLPQAFSQDEPRTSKMDAGYKSPDNDPNRWRSGDPTASTGKPQAQYGIQSPFTGEVHYPNARFWSYPKGRMKQWLEEWGTEYEARDIGVASVSTSNVRVKSLVIKDCHFDDGQLIKCKPNAEALKRARERARRIMPEDSRRQKTHGKQWPFLYFMSRGLGRPRVKRYLKDVRQGKVPLSYWSQAEYEEPFHLGCQSWEHKQSGHSQTGGRDLDNVLGKSHPPFKTAKPLKLFKKIIQLWCPPDGMVLDPFAGSGTTGQAVLEMNIETGANRRFQLIEQGNPGQKDWYARHLVVPRLKNVIDGRYAMSPETPATGGGFAFHEVQKTKVDAGAIVSLERSEMIGLILSSVVNGGGRLRLTEVEKQGKPYRYLFAKDAKNGGYYLIWDNGGKRFKHLNSKRYAMISTEAKAEGLNGQKFYVYATHSTLSADDGLIHYNIPHQLLEDLVIPP